MEGGKRVFPCSPFYKEPRLAFYEDSEAVLYHEEFVFSCFGGEMRTLTWKPTNYCTGGLISVLI